MKFDEILDKVKKIPPAPQILPQLLNLLGDEDADLNDIIHLINVDASLTAQVLKLSNSSYFGVTKKIHEIQEAIQRIGFQEVFKLVITICSKGVLDQAVESYGIEKGQLWENAIAAAFCMENMSHKIDESPSNAYIIGILHHIGKLIINQVAHDQYSIVLSKVKNEGIDLIKAEQEVLGYTHADLGAALLERWKFSESVYLPIAYQYNPLSILVPAYKKQACCLHICNWVIGHIGLNPGTNSFAMAIDPEAAKVIDFNEDELQGQIIYAQEKLDEIRGMINISKL